MADNAEFTIPGTKTKVPVIPVLGGVVILAFILLARRDGSGEGDTSGILSSEFNQRLQDQWEAVVNYLAGGKSAEETPIIETPIIEAPIIELPVVGGYAGAPAEPGSGMNPAPPTSYPVLPIFGINPPVVGGYAGAPAAPGSGMNPAPPLVIPISNINPPIVIVGGYAGAPAEPGSGMNPAPPTPSGGGGNGDIWVGSPNTGLSIATPPGDKYSPVYKAIKNVSGPKV